MTRLNASILNYITISSNIPACYDFIWDPTPPAVDSLKVSILLYWMPWLTNAIWLMHCDMTHVCVTWLMYVWHDLCMCDMTQLCSPEQYVGATPSLQHTATHCNTLQHTATHYRLIPNQIEPCVTVCCSVLQLHDITHSCVTWFDSIALNNALEQLTHSCLRLVRDSDTTHAGFCVTSDSVLSKTCWSDHLIRDWITFVTQTWRMYVWLATHFTIRNTFERLPNSWLDFVRDSDMTRVCVTWLTSVVLNHALERLTRSCLRLIRDASVYSERFKLFPREFRIPIQEDENFCRYRFVRNLSIR